MGFHGRNPKSEKKYKYNNRYQETPGGETNFWSTKSHIGKIVCILMLQTAFRSLNKMIYIQVLFQLISKGEEMFKFRKMFIVLIAAGLLLTACGGQQQTTEVRITVKEFGIESSLTSFEVGVPYHFVVTNAGSVNHEIMIMPPLTADQTGMAMDMGQLDKTALAMIAAEDLTPGAIKSFDFTFNEPASAGTLEFACHTPGHYEANMKLPISVK